MKLWPRACMRSTFRDAKRPSVRLQLTAAKGKQTGKYKIVSSKRVGSAARRGAGSLGDE